MRMYRNCPERGRKECSGCPRFKRCLVKKLKRKLKKNHLGIKILWVVFIIVMIFLLANKAEEQRKLERMKLLRMRSDVCATEVSTKFQVATVCQAIATSTLKITEKPENERQTQATKATEMPEVKATKKPKTTIKVKKAVKKVAKTKNHLEKKGYSISAEILEAYASLSAYDRKLMEKVVYAESRGEPYEGQVAVAAVILNRYIFNKKKISIESIVTAKYQFADISDVTENKLSEYPECKKAVKDAINGTDPTRKKFHNGARFFYEPDSPYISEKQLKLREGVQGIKIGGHIFHNDFNE